MTKVCILSAGLPPYYGGAELRAFRFAERLNQREDTRVTLIGWDHCGDWLSDNPPWNHVHAIRLLFRDVRSDRAPTRLAKLMLHLSEIAGRLWPVLLANRNAFDVLHIFNSSPWFNLTSIPFAKVLRKPIVLEMTLLGNDDPVTLSKRQMGQQQMFPHPPLRYLFFLMADAYISKSDALSEVYRRAGLPNEKLFQIYSGVDVQKYKPSTARERAVLRRKLNLLVGGTIILFVGGMNRRKGVHHLLSAFQSIAPHHPKAQLLIVGPAAKYDSSYVEVLHANTNHWGLSDRITFEHRFVENVHEYMKAADIFALPSRHEGLSVAILEAMASGMAIVASDIPEIAQSQIQHGSDGLLVPVGDETCLAEALSRVIDDVNLRMKLGHAARRRAVEEFSFETIDSQYLSMYKQVLKNRVS